MNFLLCLASVFIPVDYYLKYLDGWHSDDLFHDLRHMAIYKRMPHTFHDIGYFGMNNMMF